MARSTSVHDDIKKRSKPTGIVRTLSMTKLKATGLDAHKMQEKAATHDEMMQRFQLRKVSSARNSFQNFGRGKNVVIDKAIGSKRARFSLYRFLRSLTRLKARRQLMRKLKTPITPKSWTSTVHGVVLLVLYHFQLIYLPFAPSYRPGSTGVIFAMLETLFLLDLLLNFNTAYVDQGVLVTSRRMIATNYLRKWFVLDLLSAIPIQFVGYFTTHSIENIHPTVRNFQLALVVLRLLRATFLEKGVLLNRVTRVGKHLVEWAKYSRYSHLLGIAELMWLVLLIAHYMACLWHIVSENENPPGNLTVGEQYVADYYYAVSLIQGQGNTVGAWDENLFSSVAIIVGSVILAIVFGNVAMLVSNFSANTTTYHRKMEEVYATMDKMDLPVNLRQRVNEYYTHVWHEYEALDGNINKFQEELTRTLCIEIGLYKFMNLVVKIPFWTDCTPDFLTQIVLNLDVRVFMPDDYVVRRREIGSEMMMINLGYCTLSKPITLPPKAIDGVPVSFREESSRPLLTQQELDTENASEWNDDIESDEEEWASDEEVAENFTYNQGTGSAFDLQGPKRNVLRDILRLDSHRQRNSIPRKSANYEAKPTPVYVYLKPGQSFGEMSLLMNYKRTASIRAVTFVEMCVLDRETFQKIIARYPEDRRRVLTKMLESCIEKKEIPIPWENIIEAVSEKRRTTGNKDISRDRVIATMTASEAAKTLVEAIDVNIPDPTIKYGFQNFDYDFADDGTLRQVNSVTAKIKDTLQRTNSGGSHYFTLHRTNSTGSQIASLQRSNTVGSHITRRNSIVGSSSSSTGDPTDTEGESTEVSTSSNEHMGKTLENVLTLLHGMAANINRLQEDMQDLKNRECICRHDANVTNTAVADSLQIDRPAPPTPLPSMDLAAVLSTNFDNTSYVEEDSADKLHVIDSKHYPYDINALKKRRSSTKDLIVHDQTIDPSVEAQMLDRTSSIPQQEAYAQHRSAKGIKRAHNSPHTSLTDLLWKRGTAHATQLTHTPPPDPNRRRQFKARHSMPAGDLIDEALTDTATTDTTPPQTQGKANVNSTSRRKSDRVHPAQNSLRRMMSGLGHLRETSED